MRHSELVDMPDVGPFDYLWRAFQRMGYARSTAMGQEPWDWTNIQAFMGVSGLIDEPWEAELLHAMSQAYLGERSHGERLFAMPPIMQILDDDYADARVAGVANGIRYLTIPEGYLTDERL